VSDEIEAAAQRAIGRELERRASRTLDTLARDGEVEAILDDVADAVAHQLHQLTGPTTPAAASEVPAGPPADLRYPDVAEWVSHYLLRNWRRNQLANIWCTTWWEHGEAITRLKAMWLSWEDARIGGPAGLATWWRDIGDYHMGVLTSKDGPFWKCTNGRHEVPDLWESSPPEGMLDEPDPD
jgi:hypothetical protein